MGTWGWHCVTPLLTAPLTLQYTGEISAAFQKLNVTLTPISVLNESQREQLLNVCRDAQPPSFTHTLQQVWGCGRDGGSGRCPLCYEVLAPSCPMGMGCSPAVVLTPTPPQRCAFPSWIRASRWAACRSWPWSWSSWWTTW